MSIATRPAAPELRAPDRLRCEISPRAFAQWEPGLSAAASEDDRSIGMLDVIGADWWTGEGVTAKRVAGILRSLGKGPVTVNMNSPGGDMFAGLAIYNLLRAHPGEVTVKVLGMAASAASVIAMAADTIQVARAGFVMIHNAWAVAAGNRNDLREFADFLEPFDATMADVYAARTGLDAKKVAKMMDAETWIGGTEAIDLGFADELLPADQVTNGGAKASSAVRRLEAALRASGMPRSEAQRLISEFKAAGVSDSAGDVLSDSGVLKALAVQTAALSLSLSL